MVRSFFPPVKQSTTMSSSSSSSLPIIAVMTQTLLDEHLISIASYLSLQDIRNFASTCHSIRDTLMSSSGATSELWLDRMQVKFPAVFDYHRSDKPYYCLSCNTSQLHDNVTNDEDEDCREGVLKSSRRRLNLRDVQFVDHYSGSSINLPLVASLLPRRYPQTVDLSKSNGQDTDGEHDVFHSSIMLINPCNDNQHYEEQEVVPVIRFTGEVGTGDRSFRSMEPFPASCRRISTSTTTPVASVSLWMKKHVIQHPRSVVRIEKNIKSLKKMLKKKRGSIHSFDDDTNLGGVMHNKSHTSLIPLSNQSTYLTPSSSYESNSMIDTTTAASYCSRKESTDVLDTTTSSSRNEIFQASKHHSSLCPFVVPTVISTKRNISHKNPQWTTSSTTTLLTVDVTPRFAAYFEVTIIDAKKQPSCHHECVAVGLSTQAFACQDKMPGWDNKSYGYHSDDGRMFHRGKSSPPHRSGGDGRRRLSFGPGDTVGCGLEYSTRRVFFTKNGKFLDYEFDKVGKNVIDEGLYPTVGVDTECPVFINFGEYPFKFDLERFS